MQFVLPTGTVLHVRPIRPEDSASLAAGYARLSRETIRRRFLVPKPRLSSSELRYLTEVDGHDHVALVATDADGDVVAVARCIRLPERPDTAEMAVTVADPLQGQGLGTFLAQRLAEAAAAEGIERVVATTLDENEPAQRLLRTISDHLASDHAAGGVRELVGVLAA